MKNTNFFFVNNIKINNIDKNKNIIDYLENLKIKIPHYCYHQQLSIAGNCRMCLIELKNSPKPVVSCSMTIANKMVIYTDSPLVKKARENVLEFLLLNHPLDCPVCDQGGECDLQDQSMNFGTSKKRFYNYKKSVIDKNIGPIIKTVMTRCIHCTRCVRFSTEIAGVEDLGVFGRGSNMEIGTYISKTFLSELSGNVIDICPVGALTSKPYSFIDRVWELKHYKTIDYSDGFGSNLIISVKNDNVVTKLSTNYTTDYNTTNPWISDKTRFSYDGMFSPERVSQIFVETKKKKNIYFNKWSNIFKEIISIIFFKIQICKHIYKPFILTIIINNNINLESLVSLLLLEKRYNFINIRKIDSLNTSGDHTNKFIINYNKNNLNKSNLCLMINTNSRYEGSFLNINLRKRYLKGNFKIFGLNSLINLTFPYKSLGINLNILKNIVEGNHYFCQELIFSQMPLIICNSNLFKREDNSNINNVLDNLNTYLNYFKKTKEIYLNVLNSSINEVGINNLINIKLLKETDVIQSSAYYFISENFNNEYFSKLLEIKLLNYINNENEYFILEQNNLKPNVLNYFLQKNIHLNSYIYLPSKNFFESSGIYLNTEGFFKKTVKMLPSINQTKDDWKIIRQLSIFFKNNLNYKNNKISYTAYNLIDLIKFIGLNFFPIVNYNNPIYYLNNKISRKYKITNKFKNLKTKILNTKTVLWIDDFYIGGKDNYSQISKVMIECSKNERILHKNFNYLI